MATKSINEYLFELWTDGNMEELQKQVQQLAKAFRSETIKRINDLGFKGYVEFAIKEAKESLSRVQNPSPKDIETFGEGYFVELTQRAKETIDYFEGLLKDESLLKSEMTEYMNRLIEIESRGRIEDVFLENYNILPNSPITKVIKNISIAKSNIKATKIPVNKNAKLQETIDLQGGRGIYLYFNNNEKYEIVFDNLRALNKRQSIAFRKTLNFILIKANEQNVPNNIYFDLEEYQKMAGYKSKDTAYRGAIRNFDNIRRMSIGGVISGRGKGKEIRNKASYVFIARDITYNQCCIECKPELVDMLSQYFTLLPTWAGELDTKAYDLLDYIFYMARQKQNLANIQKNKSFNINLRTINENIGGHDPAETTRHTEYIIDPILNAVEEIEEKQQGEGVKITPIYNHNYKNAYDFLEGYLEIQLGKEAINYFIKRHADRQKHLKKGSKK